jgi:hypothetical protein
MQQQSLKLLQHCSSAHCSHNAEQSHTVRRSLHFTKWIPLQSAAEKAAAMPCQLSAAAAAAAAAAAQNLKLGLLAMQQCCNSGHSYMHECADARRFL